MPKILSGSMFVLLIGSFIWCFVASASDVELLNVKYVFVAVSIATLDQYLCSLIPKASFHFLV